MKTLKYLFVGFMVLGLVSMLSAAQADIITVPDPDNGIFSIQDAIDAASPGDTIFVEAATWVGAEVDKPSLTIIGEDGAQITQGVLVAGPYPLYAGFSMPEDENADNTTISNFSFDGIDTAVYGKHKDFVTVSHLTVTDCWQAIVNVGGSNWTITHNKIDSLRANPATSAGPIGISLVALGEEISNCLVAFNVVTSVNTPGLFTPGIQLQAISGYPIYNNKIVHNKAEVTGGSFIPCGLLVWAPPGSIYDNMIGFNDFRGSDPTILYYPLFFMYNYVLEDNEVSRNLGDIYTYVPPYKYPGGNRGIDPEEAPYPADLFNPQPPE